MPQAYICPTGFFAGLVFGGAYYPGSFVLQNWFSLYLEGILHLKLKDFLSKNSAPEGMWVRGGGIELPCRILLSARSQEIQAQYKECKMTKNDDRTIALLNCLISYNVICWFVFV